MWVLQLGYGYRIMRTPNKSKNICLHWFNSVLFKLYYAYTELNGTNFIWVCEIYVASVCCLQTFEFSDFHRLQLICLTLEFITPLLDITKLIHRFLFFCWQIYFIFFRALEFVWFVCVKMKRFWTLFNLLILWFWHKIISFLLHFIDFHLKTKSHF